MTAPLLLAFGLLLGAPARAQRTEQTVDDPSGCPRNTVATRVDSIGKYVCKPKLQLRRNIFGAQKHQHDPCPDGMWWKRTREYCTPVTCTEDPNPNDIKGLCPKGHHPHLSSAGDWTRPIECVVNYHPRNEQSGGVNSVRGGCELCVIQQHLPFGPDIRPWTFQAPGAAARGDSRAEEGGHGSVPGAWSSGRPGHLGRLEPKAAPESDAAAKKFKPCGEGTYTSPAGDGRCLPCAEGAATVRRSDGRVYCVGGEAEHSCAVGAGIMIVNNPKNPLACLPCIKGEESLAFNGYAQCLRNPCPEGRLPVPVDGLVDRYECGIPMEGADAVDWTRVMAIGRNTPARAPQCPAGSGIAAAGKAFECRPCAEGLDSVARNGYRICERNATACPSGMVASPSSTPGEGPVCRKCPEGSRFVTDGGSRSPRCVPIDAEPPQAAKAVSEAAPPAVAPDSGKAEPQPPPAAKAAPGAPPPAAVPAVEPPAAEPARQPLPDEAERPRVLPRAQLKDERLPPPNEPPIVMPKEKPKAWDPPAEKPKPQTGTEQGGKKKLAVPLLR